jgi:hypothetical protein
LREPLFYLCLFFGELMVIVAFFALTHMGSGI